MKIQGTVPQAEGLGRTQEILQGAARILGGPPGRGLDKGCTEPQGKTAVPDRVACRPQDLWTLALEARDLSLAGELPSLHVREGKGSKPRIVPVHPELRAALTSALEFGDVGQGDRLIRASRATADRWIKTAVRMAVELRPSPPGPRQADQLRVALAGSRLDPPHAHLPGAGAGPDRQPGLGTIAMGGRETLNLLRLYAPWERNGS